MTIKQVRDYWDARPCNVRHSAADIEIEPLRYSRECTARKLTVEPHLLTFSQFRRWADQRVLDAGCGIGTQALAFAEAGARVTAVDVSHRSLDIARQRARAEGLDGRIEFYCADLENLTAVLPEQAYSLIYSWGVLHHTPRPGAALRQLRKFADEQTEFRIMLYHRQSWKVFWILASYGYARGLLLSGWTVDDLIQHYSEAQPGSPYSRTYSRTGAAELMASAGLDVVDMQVDHIFPYRVQDYVEHRYVVEWYWRYLPPRLFRALERRFGWHLMIAAKLKTVEARRLREPKR